MSFQIAISENGGTEKARRWALNVKKGLDNKGGLYAAVGHYMAMTEVPQIIRESGPGWPPVRRGGSPLIDTGRLRNSISYVASERDVKIGTCLIYGRTHQEGLTIKPKNGKYLAIPLSPPLTPTQARTARPRDFDNTFVAKSKKGNLMIFQRTGKKVRAIYMLVKQSKIKARPYLKWTERAKDKVFQIIANSFAGAAPNYARTGGRFTKGKG